MDPARSAACCRAASVGLVWAGRGSGWAPARLRGLYRLHLAGGARPRRDGSQVGAVPCFYAGVLASRGRAHAFRASAALGCMANWAGP